MKTIRVLMLCVLISVVSHSPSHAANYMCGQDLNNDGYVDYEGETAPCGETLDGYLCPIGLVTCAAELACPPDGSYDAVSAKCIASATDGVCLSGYAYNDVTGRCEADRVTVYVCPHGAQYPCMNNGGTYQCSPNPCVDLDTNPPEQYFSDLRSYHNDGQRDNQGNCLGQIYIFSGKPGECRPAGVDTSFFNCCSNSEGSFLLFEKYCEEGEHLTNAARDAGRCRYVGQYCKTRWPIIGCVQRARVYCCFNSKLGRMIHEQGRLQLRAFAPGGQWGSAMDPNCEGFTPEEFQMLDFSRIDLSEYYRDIQTRTLQQVQEDMQEKVNEYYRHTR